MDTLYSHDLPPPAVLIVIPVYNHASTLRQVVIDCLALWPDILVVDDGSTDMPVPSCQSGIIRNEDHPLYNLPVRFIRHEKNRGKGAAILTAAQKATELGMTHIITIDADGQHAAHDIPAFLRAIQQKPATLFIGARNFNAENIPSSSRFGRSFSNFWYKVQTEHSLTDTQSGFRAYPLVILNSLSFTETRYSFETEVIVKTSWAGFTCEDIPITVYYPPADKRISHFQPLADNIRISLLNTRLTIRSLIPFPQRKYKLQPDGHISLLNPVQSLTMFLQANDTPVKLALSASLGCFIGALPLIGLHTLLIIFLAGHLRLNKIMGITTSHICMPPLVPALCIEAGYFMRNGHFLTDISLQTLGFEALDRLVDWFTGSLLIAPSLGVLAGIIVFTMAKSIQFSLNKIPQDTVR